MCNALILTLKKCIMLAKRIIDLFVGRHHLCLQKPNFSKSNPHKMTKEEEKRVREEEDLDFFLAIYTCLKTFYHFLFL